MGFASFGVDYVAQLRDGNPEVTRHFTSHFGQLLDIKLRARLRSPTLRQDACQETFLRVFSTLRDPSKRQPENLGAFVNAVCNNVVLELFRSESRTIPMNPDGPEPVATANSPEAEVVSADRMRIVRAVLEKMAGRDRELLREIFLEERDKDEVCRVHGIDREYLRVLLHRAKAKFRTALEDTRRSAAHG